MFLYPLAIVLIILAFLSPLFRHARSVYVATIIVTFAFSLVDGAKALYNSLEAAYPPVMEKMLTFLSEALPLYSQGLGWLIPAAAVIIVTGTIARIRHEAPLEVN